MTCTTRMVTLLRRGAAMDERPTGMQVQLTFEREIKHTVRLAEDEAGQPDTTW